MAKSRLASSATKAVLSCLAVDTTSTAILLANLESNAPLGKQSTTQLIHLKHLAHPISAAGRTA